MSKKKRKHQIELYTGKDGKRLKIFSPNGNEILANGQGITNKQDLIDCWNNFVTAIKNDDFEFHDLEAEINNN